MENFINKLASGLSVNSTYSAETLAFCIKLWLSTIFQTLFLFIISLLFFDIKTFLAFVITFCSLRTFIEGYHCKTFINCFLLTDFMFFAVVILSYISVQIDGFALVGKILAIVSSFGLLRKSLRCLRTDEIEKLALLYNVMRVVIVLVFATYIIHQLIYYGIYGNVHKWSMLYAYCLVYILSIRKEAEIWKASFWVFLLWSSLQYAFMDLTFHPVNIHIHRKYLKKSRNLEKHPGFLNSSVLNQARQMPLHSTAILPARFKAVLH